MTDRYTCSPPKGIWKIRVSPKRIAYVYICLFITVLFFKNSDIAAAWVTRGLSLCAKKLIPSLFPFMVLSSLAVSSGLGRMISRILRAPVRVLFGLGEDCACALITGWLCGFPVGAKCACDLYRAKRISYEEYGRVLCICSTPSPAFLISSVGSSMLGDKAYGIWLYAISLLSALGVGVFLKIKAPLGNSRGPTQQARALSDMPISRALTRAVTESASGMLSVCAFVVFFSAFIGTLEAYLSFLPLSETAHALVFAFFELASGLASICSLSSPLVFPLCALAVGWSGLSVHLQTVAICDTDTDTPSFKPYILSHTARAVICFLLGCLSVRCFG
jgi:sporulation integral membrane protein YlbJ